MKSITAVDRLGNKYLNISIIYHFIYITKTYLRTNLVTVLKFVVRK